MNINDSQLQLTLDLDRNLTERYRSLTDCMAAGVYKRGLKRVAADVDQAPGNLSVQLSDDDVRQVSLKTFERYLETSGDRTPIYYLVAKFCGDSSAARDDALAEVQQLLSSLPEVLARAGMNTRARKR